ncbi:MAG: MFS transporter [Candidatus Krumholzibacteriia bacterium]
MNPASGNAALLRRLMVSAFFMDAGFFLVLAAIPYRVLALGGGPVALGLAPAISALTYIVLTRLAGRWSDTSGRFGMILWGTLAYAAFALLAGSVARLPLLLLAMPLLGVGNALYWPTVQAAVGDLAGPGGLAREIGRFNVAWSTGKSAGYLAGGLLLAATGFRAAFLTGAGLVALAFAVLLGAGAPAPAAPAADRAPPGGTDVPEATRRAFLSMGWWANFAAYGAGGVLGYQLPKWFAAAGWHERRFGLFLAAVFLGQTVAFALLAGRVRFTYSTRRLLLPQAAAALALAALPLAGSYGLLLAAAPLLGAAFGVCYAASIYYSLDTARGKGRNAGIHESLVGAGNFVVPLLGGAAARWSGSLAAPYVVAALVMAGALLAQGRLARGLVRSGSGA